MIPSIVYTLMYLLFGMMTVRFLLPRHRPLNRLWLGMSLGLLEEMWLPALCAFFFSFTMMAHAAAAVLLTLITLVCFFIRDRRDAAGWDEKEDILLRQLMLTAVPLTMLSACLQYTHVMRADEYGSWHVGQSTFGDLPMHLSFITNLVGKKFPADYPFYPGSRLSYPFLTDSLSSTFYMLGASLQAATIIPAVLMMALCFAGVMILAREMTAGRKTVVMAALLFFLNGGLGFLYNFDRVGDNVPAVGGTGIFERIRYILEEYYKAPTNRPEDFNLRWSNVICDLMIPQRTLLGGWCMVIPCFYLMNAALRPRNVRADRGGRALGLLAVWAGALPLVHTHSFLALALMSFGAMMYDLIHGDPKTLDCPRPRSAILARYLIYGAAAAALALPQLICFTFGQALNGSENVSFLKFQFNWANNPSGGGMRDMYLWFYIKNIGLPFVALILALFEKNPRHRRIFAMMLPVILAAELIRFQPNEYDNNKLLYLAWMMGCMIVADWFAMMWRKLKGIRCRGILAVLTAIVLFLSAGLTIWRECVSDITAFSAAEVEAGEYARDETPDDAVYLISPLWHLNPVMSVAGKTVVCGPDTWLYWHGFDTRERQKEVRDFYEDPEHHTELLQKYGVEYIYVSHIERGKYEIDEAAMRRNYEIVFENSAVTIYHVPEG